VTANHLSDMVYTNDGSNIGAISGATAVAANMHVRNTINELLAASGDDTAPHQELYRITLEKADNAVELLTRV
jgi:hypothetical protein